MEDDDGRIILVDIVYGAESDILVGLLAELRLQQHILRTVLAHRHVFATVHSRKVHRSRPVTSRIDGAGLVGIGSQRTLQVEFHLTDGGRLQTTGGSSN